MKRRTFLHTGLATTAGALTGINSLQGMTTQPASAPGFKLKYAPHTGMFSAHAGEDPVDQLHFMADEGFTAFEDNGMKDRDVDTQKRMGEAMAKRGITMGVFVAHKIYWQEANLASGKTDLRDEFLQHIKDSVEVAKRVNAKWMTVVPGHLDLRLDMGYQTANVVEALRRAAEILEPHGLAIVLEPLNFRDHPGLFLTKAAQAFEICRAVDSPACKILFDIYHQQIQEGNLLPNIEAAWSEIAYFQIGDNPGRKEPTTGEINYKNVFKYIHSRGFTGVLGMEHGNSKPGKDGERAVIEAYKFVDAF
jgi:hydroxypyruvate isomerase